MKILWASNFSTQSGYANQARLFVPRIAAAGHTVTVLELGGGSGVPRMYGNIQIVPTMLDPLGADSIIEHARKLRVDAVITLTDTWAFKPEIMTQVPWYPLAPIDHMPAPPAVVRSLEASRVPIAFSRFGVDQLTRSGFNPYYVPHAVDPSVFHPMEMRAARANLNAEPDAFWVTFVGVNDSVPSRKGIPELLAAWSIFSRSHSDARLYMHTTEQGNLPVNNIGGVRIDQIVKSYEINPQTIKFPLNYDYRTGIPQSFLARMFSASDVFVLPTRGEGFGLPLLEAQRCGCPVITTDFAAGAELVFSGWKLDYEPTWTWQSAVNAQPSVTSLVESLEAAYELRSNQLLRLKAVEGAREYDIDTVTARYMLPVLQNIAERELDFVKAG